MISCEGSHIFSRTYLEGWGSGLKPDSDLHRITLLGHSFYIPLFDLVDDALASGLCLCGRERGC